ncbi:MAG TPA: hypothetical protein PK024_09885 [Methanospirillum sp.]|uniref:hypothetical protein n=1 Tax=Methanospirillum sp. TaxID=45200 RepID=UPI002C774F1B|nr:hypothetical protein [Methanospirillum sp.]HOJ97129.1 hypothetical protein [Methanospirillum sp.]HOL40240.1 hypothetical protein [Methanospirillum sp.]
MDLALFFLQALFLTIIIEWIVLSLLLGTASLRSAVFILLLNCVTNPALNYLHLIHDIPVWFLEYAIVICEIIPIQMTFHLALKDAILFSILINACSYCAGYFIFLVL